MSIIFRNASHVPAQLNTNIATINGVNIATIDKLTMISNIR